MFWRKYMKNKYLYFTSALDNNSFEEYLSNWSVSPNLSNQNFHNKLIRSLALSHDIDVISVRSINKHFKLSKLPAKIVRENNIFWKYPLVTRGRISKYLHLYRRIEFLTLADSELAFVDVLNLSLLKAAIKYRKKHNIKVIGVCTDSPNNISFIKDGYRKKLIKLSQSLDGYIVLTKKIAELYNVNNKPVTIIDGVSEEEKEYLPKEIEGKYIYFGGSLMKEYGVYNLIEAYKELELSDTKLVLCGHHLNFKELNEAIKDNENIIYLGPVSYKRNLSLEKHSVLAVNPRPINYKIDQYSIPSKSLEYLSNGVLTVTVDNPLLKEHYDRCIIWAKSGEVEDLKEAIKEALKLNRTEREIYSMIGKNKVMQYTSLENVNKQIEVELLNKVLLN